MKSMIKARRHKDIDERLLVLGGQLIGILGGVATFLISPEGRQAVGGIGSILKKIIMSPLLLFKLPEKVAQLRSKGVSPDKIQKAQVIANKMATVAKEKYGGQRNILQSLREEEEKRREEARKREEREANIRAMSEHVGRILSAYNKSKTEAWRAQPMMSQEEKDRMRQQMANNFRNRVQAIRERRAAELNNARGTFINLTKARANEFSNTRNELVNVMKERANRFEEMMEKHKQAQEIMNRLRNSKPTNSLSNSLELAKKYANMRGDSADVVKITRDTMRLCHMFKRLARTRL